MIRRPASAHDPEATVIIPAARTKLAKEPPSRRGLRSPLAIGIGGAAVLVALSAAAFLVSWSPAAGSPGASRPVTSQPAASPTVRTALQVVGNAAIAPPAATSSPTPLPTATPLPAVATSGGELCTDTYMFVPNIGEWTVPPGCYATIYSPDPSAYPSRPGFGFCNWWLRERHLDHPDITENTSLPRGDKPVAGAVVWFDPNVQGASSAGHWSQVVAVAPDGYWFLVSEMNFAWRGGGYGKVDYRYAHTGPGVVFVYA